MTDILYVVQNKNSGTNEVVPDIWYSDEHRDCYWPVSKPQESAKWRSMFRISWPKFPAQIMSVHTSYEAAVQRREKMETQVSDSVAEHLMQVKNGVKPKRSTRKTPTPPEKPPAKEMRKMSLKATKTRVVKKSKMIEGEETTAGFIMPPPKLLKRSIDRSNTTPCIPHKFQDKTKSGTANSDSPVASTTTSQSPPLMAQGSGKQSLVDISSLGKPTELPDHIQHSLEIGTESEQYEATYTKNGKAK